MPMDATTCHGKPRDIATHPAVPCRIMMSVSASPDKVQKHLIIFQRLNCICIGPLGNHEKGLYIYNLNVVVVDSNHLCSFFEKSRLRS